MTITDYINTFLVISALSTCSYTMNLRPEVV